MAKWCVVFYILLLHSSNDVPLTSDDVPLKSEIVVCRVQFV